MFLPGNPGGWCSSGGPQASVLTLLEGRMERESSSPLFSLEVQLISVGSYKRETASCRYELKPTTNIYAYIYKTSTVTITMINNSNCYHYCCMGYIGLSCLFMLCLLCTSMMWCHDSQSDWEHSAEDEYFEFVVMHVCIHSVSTAIWI